jgi:exopolyphosphatase/guanosine-5'-triphosphate,3'-diphosphate pyrophosphatase
MEQEKQVRQMSASGREAAEAVAVVGAAPGSDRRLLKEAPAAAPEDRIVAFIDIGTNSIRLLLVRILPNQAYTVLNREKEVVRLGDGEFIDQHLQPDAIRRAILVVSKFAEMARAYGTHELVTIATTATREAKNKNDFIRNLQREAGLEVRTVSGREQARLTYLGVSSGIHLGEKQALFLDIGGGSTNIIVGEQREHHFLDSLKLGAVRLSTLFFLPEETGPVLDARRALIQRYIRNAAVRTLQQIQQFRLDLAVGSSGTIETLGDIAAYRYHGRARGRDDVLTFQQVEEILSALCALSLEERRLVPGLGSNRADIIVTGAAILHTFMETLKLPEIQISDRGLREGMVEDFLLRSGPAVMLKGMTVRERSVLQLGRASGFEEPHARTVTRLALGLFDSAREAKLHKLGEWERELLEYAALLHDVGTFVSHSNHQAHTYYLIKNADLLGFDQTEINIIATVAYFHRKIFPSKKHRPYSDLAKPLRRTVRELAVLLQLAESLDRGHAGVVGTARLRVLDDLRVALEVQADQDCQLEVWGVRNNKKAFKKTFGRKLELDVTVG